MNLDGINKGKLRGIHGFQGFKPLPYPENKIKASGKEKEKEDLIRTINKKENGLNMSDLKGNEEICGDFNDENEKLKIKSLYFSKLLKYHRRQLKKRSFYIKKISFIGIF